MFVVMDLFALDILDAGPSTTDVTVHKTLMIQFVFVHWADLKRHVHSF